MWVQKMGSHGSCSHPWRSSFLSGSFPGLLLPLSALTYLLMSLIPHLHTLQSPQSSQHHPKSDPVLPYPKFFPKSLSKKLKRPCPTCLPCFFSLVAFPATLSLLSLAPRYLRSFFSLNVPDTFPGHALAPALPSAYNTYCQATSWLTSSSTPGLLKFTFS